MTWYSIKMRATENSSHISGAERLLEVENPAQLSDIAAQLTARAANHPKGSPDTINISLTKIKKEPLRIPLLPCVECPSGTNIVELLASHNIPRASAKAAEELLRGLKNMRGAAVLEVGTHRRLDPDPERGVRASTFDRAISADAPQKNHHNEARALATKVQAAPGVLAELCISDDPDYSTGYVAVAGTYFRIPDMKGASYGGRVFIVQQQSAAEVANLIEFLENAPAIITDTNKG